VSGPDEPLRIADATPADVDRVLPLHRRAFEGTMGVALGTAYLRRFLGGFVDRPDRVFLVARVGSAPAGYVFGRPTTAADDRQLLPWVALGFLRHPTILRRADIRAELLHRFRRLETAGEETPGLPQPALSLVGIGTGPNSWGRGIGQALMAAFEDQVVERGFAAARLSVYRENDRARDLYERHGWTPVDHPKPALLSYVWTNPRSTPTP
jgi:ribosomal protein S18 acetylase RimI-like enzyme